MHHLFIARRPAAVDLLTPLADVSAPLFHILLACDLQTLGRVAIAHRTFCTVLGDDDGLASAVWRVIAVQRTEGRASRFSLSGTALPDGAATWRELCKDRELEGSRQALRPSELAELPWAFNFAALVGGRAQETVQSATFVPDDAHHDASISFSGHLLLQGLSPLSYLLSSDGRTLRIADFPVHFIDRLSSWEWVIHNANVRFVSCGGDKEQHEITTWTQAQWESPVIFKVSTTKVSTPQLVGITVANLSDRSLQSRFASWESWLRCARRLLGSMPQAALRLILAPARLLYNRLL